jgi:hypothetical protein
VKQPFTDAYVEVLAPREGMGAVPYVAYNVQTAYGLAWAWFQWREQPLWIHVLGGFQHPYHYGETLRFDPVTNPPRPVRTTFVFEGKIEAASMPGSGACFSGTAPFRVSQAVLDHELAHQVDVNENGAVGHCISQAWTADGVCLMNQEMCPGLTPRHLDADHDSPTSLHGGDLFDVRVCPEELPHD